MLDFRAPRLEDQAWAAPILRDSGYIGSDGAFGTLFIWRGIYDCTICQWNGFLFRRFGGAYALPLGQGDLKQAVEALRADAEERGEAFLLTGVSEQGVKQLEALFPGEFHFEADRNTADYVYNSADLAALPGKRYHGKRNHISKFERLYTWTYERLGEENLADCKALAKEWCVQYGCSEENGLDKENCALKETFQHYQALGFVGGMIRVEGKPVAFTIGEAINDQAFVVHFEKALSDFTGSYTIINREFVARELSGYQYVNREEDMGLEGLRKAKLSYHPAILLEKYNGKLAASR